MEDRSQQRARFITILGLVLAFIAAAGAYIVASSPQQTAVTQEEKVPVVVAVRDLQARQVIQGSDVTVQQFPASVAPATAARTTQEVIGKILVAPVTRNEALTPIRWTSVQGQAAFTVLPPGEELKPDSPHYRAISISVGDASAVGGNVVPGDIVDLFATVNLDPCGKFLPVPPAPCDQTFVTDFQAKVMYESVPILARTGSVYTIRVPDLETVQKLLYLQASGAQLTMVLRAAKDDRIVRTDGTSFPSIYKDFGLQVVRRTTR